MSALATYEPRKEVAVLSKGFEGNKLGNSPTKPAPMTTILRFFSAEVLVEELKHRCIPALALTDRPLESIGRDVESIVCANFGMYVQAG